MLRLTTELFGRLFLNIVGAQGFGIHIFSLILSCTISYMSNNYGTYQEW